MRKFGSYLYDKLIRPFVESHAPIPAVCWGAVVGMFVAFTPTVGIQMYLVAMAWAISRYVFRLRFYLPVAIALVWLTNPVTVIPIYYLYLKTGSWMLEWFGYPQNGSSYHDFMLAVQQIQQANEYVQWRQRLVNSVVELFWEFGWPFVLGSFVYTIPLTILAYPVTAVGLSRYRHTLARAEGITYQEWNARHVEPL